MFASGLFQNLMDNILEKLDERFPYLDNVLIHATDVEQLVDQVDQVLTCLREAVLCVQKEK